MQNSKVTKEEALAFHANGKPGKIEISLQKQLKTPRDLALAYSPGVGFPCLEIKDNKDMAYKYTAKGNFVAVISNGTAVLGFGDIGHMAGKPVMEGKSALFKSFADIDSIDIEIKTKDPEKVIEIIENIGDTWGGINLEDIKAPECFRIETELQKRLDIPVFHDDQHGTAIISLAGLINAAEITGRKFEDMRVVVNGSGAAGISCLKMILEYGVKKENVFLCDSKGVIHSGRTDLDEIKQQFARKDTSIKTLKEALLNADVLLGLSVKDAFGGEEIKGMSENPIIFAMANPDPEMIPEEIYKTRPDAIVATGRSDYPNQINNVMCFPFLFRGALDTRSRCINEDMKIAAAKAISNLAKLEVPQKIKDIYENQSMAFGKNYIIPTPFDERLLPEVASTVALVAMKSGVSRVNIEDIAKYKESLSKK
jgi:malate dehydrogenase (oxaloacetate-decarboxylating)(NADP+)